MVSRAIVLELLGRLRDCIEKLRPFQSRPEREITGEYAALWAVERGMQVAAQCVFDICAHILSDVSTDRPPNYRELLLAAGRLGIMPEEFARRFSGLAGFRNLLIHEYAKLDSSLVYRHLHDGLADFEEFAEHVLAYLDRTP